MMFRTNAVALSAALLLSWLPAAPAAAGYYLEHEAVLPNPQNPQKPMRATIRSWHEGRRYKRETPGRGGEFVIIDLDAKKVWGVNDEKRTYWEMPAEKYKQLALMSLLVMGVKPKPDGDIITPDGIFKVTGQKGEIAGRKAYEVKINAPTLPAGMSTTFWVSKEIPLPMSRMVAELRAALGNPKGEGFKKLFDQWEALDGYPVQSVTSVNLPQGRMVTSETLLVYRDEKIPKSTFQVPKGYALVKDPVTEAEEMMQKRMQQMPAAGIGAPLQRPGGR